ncbi:MAG: hypothetical protein AB1411_09470 [Nitrospirota bacterium]
MLHERDRFRHLVAQLRAALDARGDAAFADALTECLRNATVNPQCPMGRLVLARRTKGKPPMAPPRAPAEPTGRRKALPRFVARGSREEIFEGLLSFLKTQAIVSADVPLLRALRECQRFTEEKEPNFCPVRRLLHPERPLSASKSPDQP